MRTMRLIHRGRLLLLSTLLVAAPQLAVAQSGSLRAPGYQVEKEQVVEVGGEVSSPLRLGHGATIFLDAEAPRVPLGRALLGRLKEIHGEYTKLFGTLPNVTSTLKLMPADEFYEATKTPRWTNAIYFRKQIIIPVADKESADNENLVRSLRHEYLHAIVNHLSNGRCPGWVDEGLAQWIEGDENPALRQALTRWLRNNSPVSFSLLQGGFTKLQASMVPAAYAQSLVATQSLISKYGIGRLVSYLKELGNGETKERAFERSFGIEIDRFEGELGHELKGDTVQVAHAGPHIH